jgi:hypothetical protein
MALFAQASLSRSASGSTEFTKAITRKPDGPPVMTEYQFAGGEEAHQIPIK